MPFLSIVFMLLIVSHANVPNTCFISAALAVRSASDRTGGGISGVGGLQSLQTFYFLFITACAFVGEGTGTKVMEEPVYLSSRCGWALLRVLRL